MRKVILFLSIIQLLFSVSDSYAFSSKGQEKNLSEINRTDVSRIPLKNALVIGNAKAKHKVIVFDDPE